MVEEGEVTCALLERDGLSPFAERHFLLAKILDTRAVVPLGTKEHVQQKL